MNLKKAFIRYIGTFILDEIRNKKAEVTPKMFVFGVIAFTLIIMSGVGLMAEFASDKPASFINNDAFLNFNRSFNNYNDVIDSGTSLKESITDTKADKGLFGVLDSLINAVWSSISNIFSTFDFMSVALTGLTSVFGVPTWAVALITTLIIVMFAFSIYSLIFQGKA